MTLKPELTMARVMEMGRTAPVTVERPVFHQRAESSECHW